MAGKIIIKEIIIHNFRSIRSVKLKIENHNIFVGLNDVGKSNLLKALNLFFNNQTDYGQNFDFSQDFTYLYSKKSKRKKEIKIQIIFSIPDHYKVEGDVVWEKRWNIDGSILENIQYKSGAELPPRSKVPSVLRSMKYRYIPAVKSREYYKGLLSELYQAVSASLTSPLKDSIEQFTNVLSSYTEQIGRETIRKLGLTSTLTMPSDLSELFKTLVFETQESTSSFIVNLERRGDGIQARHIPYILNYIAEEDQKSRGRRATSVYTVWGFEEPENGLEMSKAFEMASDFMAYSEHIQMFISTHSPAFYLNSDAESGKVFYALKNERGETYFSDNVAANDLDNRLGMMPLIAPYIKQKQEELERYKKLLADGSLSGDIDTILVEGKYDKLYLEKAIQQYSPRLQEKLTEKELRVFTKPGEGGCNKVVDIVKSFYYYGNKSKIYSIFDRDDAGEKSKGELVNFIQAERIGNVKSQQWEFTGPMKLSCGQGIVPTVEVEHFLSFNIWLKLIELDMVEEKTHEELYKQFGRYASVDKSFRDIMREKGIEKDDKGYFNLLNPKDDRKEQIYNLAMKEITDGDSSVLQGLKPTIWKLEEFFLK